MPNGSASYAFLLHNDLMELRLAKVRSRNKETYPIFVHFKSELLWSIGPENCWAWFHEWVTSNFEQIISNKVNRVDLCCHTYKAIKLDPEYYRGFFSDHSLVGSNRENTGIYFGSRKTRTVYARIYNKSKEIKRSRKNWFKSIWQRYGLNEENVYNVEFELNRRFIRTLLGQGRNISSCEDLFKNIKSIWEYCTEKWLVMLEEKVKRSDRARIHNVWKEIQSSFANYSGDGMVSRQAQKKCRKEILLPLALGYITSFAAYLGEKNMGTVLSILKSEGQWNLHKRGKDFGEIVDKKMKLLGTLGKGGETSVLPR